MEDDTHPDIVKIRSANRYISYLLKSINASENLKKFYGYSKDDYFKLSNKSLNDVDDGPPGQRVLHCGTVYKVSRCLSRLIAVIFLLVLHDQVRLGRSGIKSRVCVRGSVRVLPCLFRLSY